MPFGTCKKCSKRTHVGKTSLCKPCYSKDYHKKAKKKKYGREYYQRNKDVYYERFYERKEIEVQRSFSYDAEEMRKLQAKARKLGLTLDHIHALRPKDGLSCGLHVSWNIRLIKKKENLRRGNRDVSHHSIYEEDDGE
jgi:hypothetical protein